MYGGADSTELWVLAREYHTVYRDPRACGTAAARVIWSGASLVNRRVTFSRHEGGA